MSESPKIPPELDFINPNMLSPEDHEIANWVNAIIRFLEHKFPDDKFKAKPVKL